jgi:hypothetical protein
MPDQEHRVVCEITTIFEVTDPEIAVRRPFCLALDQTRDPYGRLYMSSGRKVLVTAAVRAQLQEGDKVTLAFRDKSWDTEFVGLWKGKRKLAGAEDA